MKADRIGQLEGTLKDAIQDAYDMALDRCGTRQSERDHEDELELHRREALAELVRIARSGVLA